MNARVQADSVNATAISPADAIALIPNREALADFSKAIFKNADPKGFVSARGYLDNGRDSQAIIIESVALGHPQYLDVIVERATQAAEWPKPVVFCPPIVTFISSKDAKTDNILEGVAISFDCDASPVPARESIVAVLGEPTVTVASGGEWNNPDTGEVERKCHLHWRLKDPTKTPADHKLLYEARELAAELFGGDPTAKSLVHPLRWPGSWHRKGEPKLAEIVELNDTEIDLHEAIKVLREAAGRREETADGFADAAVRKQLASNQEHVALALREIPNKDLSWADWNYFGLATWGATGGSDVGFNAFAEWSAKSSKSDPVITRERWEHYKTSPPNSLGFGTLVYHARQHKPGWGAETAVKVRPTIRIAGGNLPEIVDQAEQALIEGDFSLYQRGSLLVKPAPVPVDIADNKTTTAVRLAAVRSHLLVEMMTKAATWQRFDIRKNDWVSIDCPERVANTLLAREQWNLPILSGIVNCPVLRPDGSVVEIPGYDAATGLLFDPQGVQFDRVPDSPDKAAARRALDVLKDLIKTFPFVTKADESVALSAILTALHRRSLPTAPLHGFSAPGAGSGKSKLVDIASLIVDGREAAVMSLGRGEEEAEKRLGAALLAGDAIVSIDNIDAERPFGGELFCQALTQRMLKVRILGLSKNVEVPSNAAIFANGNNLTLVGDMTRRAIMCNIDSGEERPELRVFDRNPLAMVRADRNKYVIAALTVLKAFHVAGRPGQTTPEGKPITPLGSFEEWSNLIRGSLIWLGEADPCDTMEKIRKKDPKLGAMTAVVSQWLEVIGHNDRVTAKELINHATEENQDAYDQYRPGPRLREFKNPEFRDALLIVAGDGGAINSLKLGKWLGANQDRFVLGYKIVQDGERGGSKLWKLEPKTGPVDHAPARTHF